MMARWWWAWIVLTASAASAVSAAGAQTRDLVLSAWEPERWSLYPGMRLEQGIGQTPHGEPLTRLTLPPGDAEMTAFTQVNLPATAGELSMFLRKTPLGAGRHYAVFQESHGWGGTGTTLWALSEDTTYRTSATKPGWSWRVGFFKSQAAPPFRFRGFKLRGRPEKEAAGQPVTVEAGPIHVSYAPDDRQWLYADLQPKVIPSRDGVLAPLTLRLANLGTRARTFRLTAAPVSRNLKALSGSPLLSADLTLQPGEQRDVPVPGKLALLGRYEIEYRVAGDDGATVREAVAVVNGYDRAEGFRRWAARRQWFSVVHRRPGTGPDGRTVVTVGTASNGLSPVPIFPVQRRTPRKETPLAGSLPAGVPPARPLAGATALPEGFSLLTSMLSPAWVVNVPDRDLRLFSDTAAYGLGAPSHVAYASAGAARVLGQGGSETGELLRRMSQPWLLVWWQGSKGWTQWDMPFLVRLQHRPTAMSLDENGVHLQFSGPAGKLAVMPLYGYAKLPQQEAFAARPSAYRLPASWPVGDLQTWRWPASLPASVVSRCNWWARALTRYPYNVHESFRVDHATGAVVVSNTFDYLPLPTDWNTQPLLLAPFSPTMALALQGGYPMTPPAKLTDCQYPTLFGPYCAVEGTASLQYSLNVGPYLLQTADASAAMPTDRSTPGRRAQGELMDWALGGATDIDDQMWDWRDENFVWYAQSGSNREPSLLMGITPGGLRLDRKGWMQARTLYTLLDKTRYKMDERDGTLTRRYIDGPGIGNWGSGDWGDSGKLGTDMVYDAYTYAYNTGDYQAIADNWDTLTSLAMMSTNMSWLSVGRSAIAEMGDEAPTMLALARLAYAVGDREEYAAAAYWYARELVHHCVKDGAFVKWRDQFLPWHPGLELPTETATNLWGTNAAWVGGGFGTTMPGENQWSNFPVRFDDMDTIRFHRDHVTELPARVSAAATAADSKGDEKAEKPNDRKGGPFSYVIYWDRAVVLAKTPKDAAAAQAAYQQGDPFVPLPANYACREAVAALEFLPRAETLIPRTTPPVADGGWAWDQMGNASFGMVLPSEVLKGKLPTPQLFWWSPPAKAEGAEWGDKWTFGSIVPGGMQPPRAAPRAVPINAQTVIYPFGSPPPVTTGRAGAPNITR